MVLKKKMYSAEFDYPGLFTRTFFAGKAKSERKLTLVL